VSPECSGKNGTPTQSSGSFSNSLKQQGVIVSSSNEQELSKAPIVESISMPLMHPNDQGVPVDLQNMQIHEGGIVSKPFSEPIGCVGSSATYKKNDSSPYSQIGLSGQRSYFSPHWPVEAVEKALEVSNTHTKTHVLKL
jgi:DIS3-like exonuclease 2